jgi:hypothetical protein
MNFIKIDAVYIAVSNGKNCRSFYCFYQKLFTIKDYLVTFGSPWGCKTKNAGPTQKQVTGRNLLFYCGHSSLRSTRCAKFRLKSIRIPENVPL